MHGPSLGVAACAMPADDPKATLARGQDQHGPWVDVGVSGAVVRLRWMARWTGHGGEFGHGWRAVSVQTLPTWATRHGCDQFGAWLAASCQGLELRLRCIAPGAIPEVTIARPHQSAGDLALRLPLRVDQPFFLAETPCTQQWWSAVTGSNPSLFHGAEFPVDRVSWGDCQHFLARLKETMPGANARLPTAAEWEFACRAGSSLLRFDPDAVAWHIGNSDGTSRPVGRKAANPWGLYDMLGNVDEWCQDLAYASGPDAATVRSAVVLQFRTVRGGSRIDDPSELQPGRWRGWNPAFRLSEVGFRIAIGV